jgi:hypothetical protein
MHIITDIDPVLLNAVITMAGIVFRIVWASASWLRNRNDNRVTVRLETLIAEFPADQRVAAIDALADLERARRRLW